MSTDEAAAERIDRLLDAIELVKEDRNDEARRVLQLLIQEDNDFEDGWLWMSVVVDSVDQSILCLDNVLRVNPNNAQAAAALYRLREHDMRAEERRSKLRFNRDLAMILMWLLIFVLMIASIFSFYSWRLPPV